MSDLEDFARDLVSTAMDLQKGKYAKQFMRKEGTKLRKETVKEAKKSVNKKTGNLFRGIKKGKAIKSENSVCIDVYGDSKVAPHLYLINNGHIIKGKDGTEHGFKEGVHFLESAEEGFSEEYEKDCLEWIDDLLDNHGL